MACASARKRGSAASRPRPPGVLLIVYLLVRELTAAVGLTGLGGHPQMVRPLIAPMAEGATETRFGKISDAVRFKLRAFSAATDNVGLFFGEDIFVAFGAIVLMTTFLKEAGIIVEPIHVARVGHSDRDLRVHHSRLPAVSARPQARTRTARQCRSEHRRRCADATRRRRQSMTFTITYLFWLLGVVLLVIGGMIVTDKEHPRRFTAGGFWILYALIFLIGDKLPPCGGRRAGDRDGADRRLRRRDRGQAESCCRSKRARRAPRVWATSCSCPR